MSSLYYFTNNINVNNKLLDILPDPILGSEVVHPVCSTVDLQTGSLTANQGMTALDRI